MNHRRLSALASVLVAATSLGAQQSALIPDSLLMPVPASQLAQTGRARMSTAGPVIVPTVLLHVSLHGSIRAGMASVRTNTAVTVTYAVVGLEKPVVEEIAQFAHGELVGRLRRAGLAVASFDSVSGHPAFARLARLPLDSGYGAPIVRDDYLKAVYGIVAPTDTQAIGWRGNEAALAALAKELGATVVIPELWFQAPQLQRFSSLIHGGFSIGATVASSMDLERASLRFVTPSGDTGSISLKAPLIGLSDNIGEVRFTRVDTTALMTTAAGMRARVLGRPMVDSGVAPQRPARQWMTENDYEVVVAPSLYTRAVLRGASSFFQAAATLAAKK